MLFRFIRFSSFLLGAAGGYRLASFDPVAGAHHFDVSDERAATLVRELMEQLPGFLVPKLVRELPGEASKTPIPVGI